MKPVFERHLTALQEGGLPYLKQIGRGIEKEGLRTDLKGRIAQTDHPTALGHALTHPSITTDYAESLLELITPVCHSTEAVITELTRIHQYVQAHLGNELMWAGSMPCELEGEASIVIAKYGDSNLGKLKTVYREGLGVRYGRIMQSIAGMHYNFSLPDAFWEYWKNVQRSQKSLKDFKSEQYFALIRNFRRYSWLPMYLFGASPAVDHSFLTPQMRAAHPDLKPINQRTFLLPGATSLRMGDMGYHNNAQSDLSICFNKLENFIATLYMAIHTPYPAYEAIGTQRDGKYIQLNTNILQIENEYYSSIRPKRPTHAGEKPIQALSDRGVEYVEVRCLDLNPYSPVGTTLDALKFMDVFLLTCLFKDSPWIDDQECSGVDINFNRTVRTGRTPGMTLTTPDGERTLTEVATELMAELRQVAQLMGDPSYLAALETQQGKIHDASLTPSARMEKTIREDGIDYLDLVTQLSKEHQQTLQRPTLTEAEQARFATERDDSLATEQSLRQGDTLEFSEYLTQYLS